MMFSFMLVDGDQPLRLCKHCQKVFLGLSYGKSCANRDAARPYWKPRAKEAMPLWTPRLSVQWLSILFPHNGCSCPNRQNRHRDLPV